MEVRDRKLDQLKEKLNSVEDDVFADFCASIGVANIRQYEERELRYVVELARNVEPEEDQSLKNLPF